MEYFPLIMLSKVKIWKVFHVRYFVQVFSINSDTELDKMEIKAKFIKS